MSGAFSLQIALKAKPDTPPNTTTNIVEVNKNFPTKTFSESKIFVQTANFIMKVLTNVSRRSIMEIQKYFYKRKGEYNEQ